MLDLLLAGLLLFPDPNAGLEDGADAAEQEAPKTLGERFPLTVTEDEAQSRASKRLLRLAIKTWNNAELVRYQHRTSINRSQGRYYFDCSGMMNWMLAKTAPKALETLDRERPVARTYVREIGKAPVGKSRGGWQQVKLVNVAPGDIFAWLRPPDWPKGGNTGHVGIVLSGAEKVHDWTNAYTVRVMDASQYSHEDDTRDGTDQNGLGSGTLLFIADDEGFASHYGWVGTESQWVHETTVVFGRVTR